jgi:prepilin-type N-terminal cleavage/methylation domain-containing protein
VRQSPTTAGSLRLPIGHPHHAVREGFTLLEVMLVVLIGAILAGAAILSLSHSAAKVSVDDTLRRIVYLDNLVRHTARQSGNVQQIILDLTAQTITEPNLQAASDSSWLQSLHMTQGIRIERAWVIGTDQSDSQESGQSEGQLSIPCSADGYMPTYALELTGRDGQMRCLVMAGLSGQASEVVDEKQVQSIFAAVGAAVDTDAASASSPVQ